MGNEEKSEMSGKMDDLRQGRLEATPYYYEVDLPFYKECLKSFLPDKIVDFHVHAIDRSLWDPPPPRHWAHRVCPTGVTFDDLLEMYRLIYPDKQVRALVFGHPVRYADTDGQNRYIGQKAKEHGQWGLAVSDPEWHAQELEEKVLQNDLLGIKPYLTMMRGTGKHSGAARLADISIFGFLPRHQLEVADAHRWIVMLHLPRRDRIADPRNIAEIHEICQSYPDLQLVIAHVGRAYCPKTARAGIPRLTATPNLYADISANSCQVAFELLIDALGPRHILYGTDLPPTAMRAKRECDENGEYYNIVRGADWEDERTRRRPEEEDTYTFFIYEGILAFRRAAEKRGLSQQDVEDVFYNNATRLVTAAGGRV
jgi:predicted TIM-barrel fold metal-dependent hydrolase